ncbi:MAG: RutC family protein [Candidatus Hydrogenedentota bacterium]
MEKRCITSPNSLPATAPYSHAVAVGNLLFVSGQVCLAPDGSGPKNSSFEVEVRQTLDNLKTILEDSGSGLQHVAKTTVFLSDMNNFAALNAIYREYFPDNQPARTCIQAGRLPLNLNVEVEAVAVIPGA